MPGGGFVGYYRDLGGVEDAALDALIARQRDFFAARGETFEWKTYGHDAPADLTDRLRAAGFVPEDVETVVVGAVDRLAVPVVVPPGVVLREVTSGRDLERIAAMETAVWGTDRGHLAGRLAAELAANPDGLTIVVAEAGGEVVAGSEVEAVGEVVAAGWIRFGPRRFASLWGGSTLAEWRRRGIYRALVAYRARLAAERGYEYLQVDASENSRPVLERLGMSAITTTTPYIWKP
jgi:hypothetical protein